MFSLKYRLGVMAGAFVLSVSFGTGQVSAAALTSDDLCENDDVSETADDCFGQIAESPINDSEDVLNNNTFDGENGLFGINTWSFLAKQNTPGLLEGTDIGLSVTPSGGAASGSWSVDAGTFDLYEYVALILKGSNSFVAYLYEPGSNAGDSGTWTTVGLLNPGSEQPNLSHLSFYTSGSVPPCDPSQEDCDPPPPIPLPAAGWMLLAGVGGLAAMRRRRKS